MFKIKVLNCKLIKNFFWLLKYLIQFIWLPPKLKWKYEKDTPPWFTLSKPRFCRETLKFEIILQKHSIYMLYVILILSITCEWNWKFEVQPTMKGEKWFDYLNPLPSLKRDISKQFCNTPVVVFFSSEGLWIFTRGQFYAYFDVHAPLYTCVRVCVFVCVSSYLQTDQMYFIQLRVSYRLIILARLVTCKSSSNFEADY